MDVIPKGSRLSVRFPRFAGNYRINKAAEDATPIDEVVKMYKDQLKKIEEYRNTLLILKGPSSFSLLLSYKTS